MGRLRRYGLFGLLYFVQGIPSGFIFSTLLIYLYKNEGWNEEMGAGMLAVVGLPWVFKAFVGPLIDKWGSYMAWIACSTLVMALAILAIPFFGTEAGVLTAICLLHNMARTFQDVATDALAIDMLEDQDKGPVQTVMRAGAYLGHMLGAGGMLVLVSRVGLFWVCMLVAGLILVSGLLVPVILYWREAGRGRKSSSVTRQYWKELLASFWSVSGIAALAICLLAHICEGGTGAVFGKWLVELGYSEDWMALIDTASGVVKIVGTVVGGVMAFKWPLRKALACAVIFKALVYASLGLFAAAWGLKSLVFVMLMMTSLGDGIFIVVITAGLMSLTRKAVAASQFAVFMAAMNLSVTWTVWVGGKLSAWQGMAACFIILGVAQLLLLVPMMWVEFEAEKKEVEG